MGKTLSRLRAFLRSPWGVLVKVVVSLSILLWFSLQIDYGALSQLLAAGRPEYLLVLALFSLLRIAIAAFRFRLLTDLLKPIKFRELFKQRFVATYFNTFLPTALGGDAVRLFMMADCGLPKQQGVVLIFIERLMGIFALVLLAVVGVLTFPVPSGVEKVVFVLAASAGTALAVVLLSRRTMSGLARRLPVFERAWQALALLSTRRGTLGVVFAISIAFQILTICLSWLVAVALDIEISFYACLALVPLVWVLTAVPVTIGGIGVREASFVYLFGLVGVSAEASLLISLGTFASLLLIAVIGAGLFFSDSVVRRLKFPVDRGTMEERA